MNSQKKSNANPKRETRFELWSLFGLITVCGILSALTPIIGVAAAAALMVMAFALAMRFGRIALFALLVASLTSDLAHDKVTRDGVFFALRQIVVVSAAAVLCIVYGPSKGPTGKFVRRRLDKENSSQAIPSFVISAKSTAWIRGKA